MISAKRVVQRSLTSRLNPDMLERREGEILNVDNPVQRFGLRALHTASLRHPRLMAGLFGAANYPEGTKIFCQGTQSLAIHVDSTTVLKVEQESLTMTSRERERFAANLRYEHAALCQYVGEAVVPHEIAVGGHPLLPRRTEAVLISQEYRDLDFVSLITHPVDPDPLPLDYRLQQTKLDYPHAIEELEAMLAGSRQLYAEEDLGLDIIGENMGFDFQTGALTIVDSQPITTRHEDVLRYLPRFYDELGEALASVRS